MKIKTTVMVLLLCLPVSAIWSTGAAENPQAGETASTVLQLGAKDLVDPSTATLPRVVSCGKGFSLVLNALYMFPEAPQSIVAFGKTSQSGGNFIEYLDGNFKDKALFTMDVSAEEIAAHKPDHVVLKSYLAQSIGAQLESLGIDVLYVDLETVEQYAKDIEAIGRMFGNPARAAALKEYFQEKRQQVIDMTAPVPPDDRPEALFLYYTATGGAVTLNVPPVGWMQTSMFDWAGADAVWNTNTQAKGWTPVGFEQIAAWNPGYIFLVSYHMPIAEAKASLAADANWQELAAVKNGKLLAFPGDYLSWDQPDPRWLVGLYWLTGTLHPELISPDDIDGEVREFFHFVWNIPEDAVETDILSRITGDYR